jgi:hypothetical protein
MLKLRPIEAIIADPEQLLTKLERTPDPVFFERCPQCGRRFDPRDVVQVANQAKKQGRMNHAD